ncbi:FhaA domain-containing protein [Clavibacter sepedonicus]|uniref:Uncharacterized protein n=1 Tax=Clavibacter sepedonicus TaxID=31964 RepID=B0RH91_CLASE|nr:MULTISPECIES: DUF3662 and FHA domain-containing protein [Clavibacter]MBD5381431.1 DUF3662 and FHA domain-containing protein [Clavibacter sp.]OQJ48621.1 phosphopeptide-binding protein [Clavibacter sepedonicus]OQJ54165.1 phosphopeptide-binding protein [Clavibacter sepedonicus]UUK65706.1 DUF3662 domain-containing protein [Clavibacter sepedonicus]CAQ00149.1 conserved hypothetical protein [Clavibacter sepedonicus]
MGILDNFEKGLERAVNGAFVKTFKSGLQPVEIAAQLRRELDTHAAVVDRDLILVPNSFTLRVSRADAERMASIGTALTDQLRQAVEKHASSQGYQFAGVVQVGFREDDAISEGVLEIDSRTAEGSVTWMPVVDVAGARHPLPVGRTVIGRGSDADITVDDPGTSRRHVEIAWDGTRAQVRDLGSTNGSELNGAPVTKAPLPPESVIRIGRTAITFRVVPQATEERGGRDTRGQRHDDGFWGAS